MKKVSAVKILSGSLLLLSALVFGGCSKAKREAVVKVGLLHSLSGSMAMSETAVRDAELLAIQEINERGGVLGHRIEAVTADGESNPQVFAKRAVKLLEKDNVATVFGCWMSTARKAVKPIFEEHWKLLWYPVQYEGMEASPCIMYAGSAPNQQIVPAVDYCIKKVGKRVFLVGSDYIFARTANQIIRAHMKTNGGIIVGEEYASLDCVDYEDVVRKIKEAKPDFVMNTINGESNIAFFHQLYKAGIRSSEIPVMSFSIAEGEVYAIDKDYLVGHLCAWNYFQTTSNEENRAFVAAYKKAFGENRVTSSPIEAAYLSVHLWAKACEKAGTFETEPVRIAAKGLEIDSPEGHVVIDGLNQHLYKPFRVGRFNDRGLIDELYFDTELVKPDPYLSTYAWARGL